MFIHYCLEENFISFISCSFLFTFVNFFWQKWPFQIGLMHAKDGYSLVFLDEFEGEPVSSEVPSCTSTIPDYAFNVGFLRQLGHGPHETRLC